MIKALGNYVLLSIEKKKENKNEVAVADLSKQKSAIMKVESVGDEVTGIKKGDVVLVNPFAVKYEVEKNKLYVFEKRHIFGIIN